MREQKKINLGRMDYFKSTYTKYLKFSSAVLWMDRELSVPMSIMDQIQKYDIQTMFFIDQGKREQWKFKVMDVLDLGKKKKVGQEEQWYFPIDKAIRKQLEGRNWV